MGRLPNPESSDPTTQAYPNQHENALASQPQDDAQQSARSYVSQSQEDIPSFEKQTYPPPQPTPAAYPPPLSATAYPPQAEPVQYPPQQQQQPQAVQFPPQQQQQPQAVQFPPQQQQSNQFAPQQNYNPQPFNYSNFPNAQNNGVPTGYQTPGRIEGIAVGSQYLPPTQGWSKNNGLFDFCEDPENAFITACFPCITFGQIAEVVDNGQTSCATSGLIYGIIAAFIGIPCIMSCSYRTKIRNRYGLMETPAPDWVTHCFCEWCALCQEYRELKARGVDPAIGWQGNMMRNQQQYPMNSPMNQRMI